MECVTSQCLLDQSALGWSSPKLIAFTPTIFLNLLLLALGLLTSAKLLVHIP